MSCLFIYFIPVGRLFYKWWRKTQKVWIIYYYHSLENVGMRKLSIVSNFHRRQMKRCEMMLCYGNIFPEHDQLEINSTEVKKKIFRPVMLKRCLQINRMKSFTFIFAHHLDTSNVLYRASNYTLRRLKTQMRTKKQTSRVSSRYSEWCWAKVKFHIFFFFSSPSFVSLAFYLPGLKLFFSQLSA